MDVIRHDNITPDRPAVVLVCSTPFSDQDAPDLVPRENLPAITCARRDEKNRGVQPNTVEAPQMFVH